MVRSEVQVWGLWDIDKAFRAQLLLLYKSSVINERDLGPYKDIRTTFLMLTI